MAIKAGLNRRVLRRGFPNNSSNANLVVPSFWPIFALPFNDLGAGQVNTTPSLAAGSATANMTRATVAWTTLSNGLLGQVATGVARSCYSPAGIYLGYLPEPAATNEALQSRDITNAAWTKTSVTAAKDQTGADGTANGACSMLATGANGTVTQAIASASNTTRRFSVYMKRLVGTGQILMSLDNGATTTDVSGSINSSTYTRVGAGQTLANPTVMWKIVTSGDKVAVDFVQEEATPFDTTPIVTAGATVTRNADFLTYPTAGNISSTVGTCYAEITTARTASSSSTPKIVSSFNGAGGTLEFADIGGILGMYDNTAHRVSTTAVSLPATTPQKVAFTWNGTAASAYLAGVGTAIAAFDGDLNLTANMGMGNNVSGSDSGLAGTMRNVKIFSQALTAAQIAMF